jgi:hypothetical protein
LECGPCIVGDEKSDPELMAFLDAEKKQEKGQFFMVSSLFSLALFKIYETLMFFSLIFRVPKRCHQLLLSKDHLKHE